MAKNLPGTDPESEDFPQGPAIGETVPTFGLIDQFGKLVRYEPDGKRRSLILFHRSADW